jgi:hypothetical protein
MFGLTIAPDWLDILKDTFICFLIMGVFGTIMCIGFTLGEIQEEKLMEKYEKKVMVEEIAKILDRNLN